MQTANLQCSLQKGIIDYITRMLGGGESRHAEPDWSDWYDSWYASLNVCEAVAIKLGTGEARPNHPLFVSSTVMINHLQHFTRAEYKDQKSSVGWSDGVKDCVKLVEKLSRECGDDVISIRKLQAELDRLRRYPREHRLR